MLMPPLDQTSCLVMIAVLVDGCGNSLSCVGFFPSNIANSTANHASGAGM